MRIHFRPLWTVTVEHEFFDGECDALEFSVPASTARTLGAMRAIARVRNGQLLVLLEIGEDGQPIASAESLVGRTLHFGLKPHSPSFDTFTAGPGLPRGQRPWWSNAVAPNAIGAPRGVALSGERLRVEPVDPARPTDVRVLTPGNEERAAFRLRLGAEGQTLPELWPDGEWHIEETAAGSTSTHIVLVDAELAASGAWGVLSLTVAAAHLPAGQEFRIAFAPRADTLRYYVVAERFTAAGFAQLEVLDGGFAADGRPQISFDKLLPAAFGPKHLQPALLDAGGDARIALFESRTSIARRARGPTRLELQSNGDVLVGHLPAPGADRPDAQFVVHLSKP